ncbi:MAG: hypothetical protein IJY52_03630 [Anaerotignum sp.]|nr:hypothetical protein [Anaerotignum sp.]
MTRGRDVFWGIYAAVVPFFVIHMFGKWERMMEQYLSRTYDTRTALFGMILLALLYGIMLAVVAVRFLSKPVETSRIPLIGLGIGAVYCVFLVLVVFVEYWMGVQIPTFIFQLTYYTHWSLRFVSVTAFYIVILVMYMKMHTFVPKEDLRKEMEQ